MSIGLEDVLVWLKGLIGAGISGTAVAISSGISASVIAPDTFNLENGLYNLLKMIAITAIVSFVASVAKYLAQKPLPEDVV